MLKLVNEDKDGWRLEFTEEAEKEYSENALSHIFDFGEHYLIEGLAEYLENSHESIQETIMDGLTQLIMETAIGLVRDGTIEAIERHYESFEKAYAEGEGYVFGMPEEEGGNELFKSFMRAKEKIRKEV